jgi:catechol 2,3-dioxygenase-like lactoylglutathione lyase family enzyme
MEYLYVKMMKINIKSLDHVVFRVGEPERSLDFYAGTLGLQPLRVGEYRAARVPFPSVRISDQTIVDFLKFERPQRGNANVDHIALTFANTPEEIRAFLRGRRISIVKEMTGNFGAQGDSAHSFHVHDPDENVLELQSYSGD